MTEHAPGDDTRAQDREDVANRVAQRRPARVRARQPWCDRRSRGADRPARACARDGAQRVRRASGRGSDRAAGGGRAEGPQPVGVRAHPLLPPPDGRRQPLRAVPDLPGRNLRQACRALRLRRARPPQHHVAADAEGQASLRHRPARPRLPQPRHLRPADVALGRLLRRVPLDGDRDDDRRALRLLRGRDRQPADAVHRPDPDSAGPRGAADRRHVLRQRRPAQGRRDPRAPALDGDRAHRPRCLPLTPREGIRRSRQGQRRRRLLASSCVTCFRTRSGRSSSTRR